MDSNLLCGKMGCTGNTKQPALVSPPRRSGRRRRRTRPRTFPMAVGYVYKKSSRKATHISNLTDDALLRIFAQFGTDELFYNLRPVCKRWRSLAMSPTLWREIDARPEIPTGTLLHWIKSSPLLRSFTIKNRRDTNVIAEELSRNCRQLRSIRIQQCWGSPKKCLIRSAPLCNLVTRCPELLHYDFSNSRFMSRKFFRLIYKDQRRGDTVKKCDYVGPMTPPQMWALFCALRECNIRGYATIGNTDSTQMYKLGDVLRCLEGAHYARDIVDHIVGNLNGV